MESAVQRNRIVTIENKRGEYTGSAAPVGNPAKKIHYFSMYDGSVIRLTTFDGVVWEDGKPPEEFGPLKW